MTLYRKYRPQTLSELDSVVIRDRLKQVLSSEYVPSAFLFVGPKGTGKTSTARIVAKIVNCQRLASSKIASSKNEALLDAKRYTLNADSIDPCNTCDSCIAITNGSHLDVIEIDAASNRGIEEVRDLRDKIKLAPVSAKFKVYIIDEVHMMTNEAFNALLKTLEEPPSHALFIFATTEPDKLPATISSRCTLFQFTKATVEEIISSLKRVVKGEKKDVASELLEMIAQNADGSFRDGTKLLEQVFAQELVDKEHLNILLGRSYQTPEEFLGLVMKKNPKELLEVVQKMVEKGTDFKYFVSDVLHNLHSFLLVHYGVEKSQSKMNTLFTVSDILKLIKLFSRVYTELRNSSKPEIPLEVALVEWSEEK